MIFKGWTILKINDTRFQRLDNKALIFKNSVKRKEKRDSILNKINVMAADWEFWFGA